MKFIIIYITHKNREEASKITAHLLEKRLIACANIFPIQSSYRWQGKIENEDEVVSIVKTRRENWESVKSEVKRIHPYEVPCIIKIEVEANEDYAAWIGAETVQGNS
ncbi:MAG: divalent-cation tolerance protein CutA [Dehalococcoidia bacterium]|nr:divalent-cation tolerance protein CutA [Dehalococcoidia bacterium]